MSYYHLKRHLQNVYFPKLKECSLDEFRFLCQFNLSLSRHKRYEQNFSDHLFPETPNQNFEAQASFFHDQIQNPSTKYGGIPPDQNHCLGMWNQAEENNFIDILNTIKPRQHEFSTPRGGVDWDRIASFVPYRDSIQCKNKYYNLLRFHRISPIFGDPDVLKQPALFRINQLAALLPKQEQQIVDVIEQRIDNGDMTNLSMIQRMAFELYYSPLSLAERAVVFSFYLRDKLEPLDENGDIKEKFRSEFDQRTVQFLELATNEPQRLIEEFSIPNFQASSSWASDFLKRHGRSYKAAHYERRGAVDPEFIQRFVDQLAHAITNYGIDRVVNMDETHVFVSNPQLKTFSWKGQDTVSFHNPSHNDKEGTTVIATCSAVQKYPLMVLAKGSTGRCTRKFHPDESESVFVYNGDGWTDEPIMLHYLKWIHQQMGEQPFALVLDVFAAHITENVKNLAQELGIELIFVPACGTGHYQPLDRKIFGIIKSKLRAAQRVFDPNKHQENRYFIIQQHLEQAWREVSEEALDSAWDIPGVADAVEMIKISCDTANEDQSFEDKNDPDWIEE